MAGKRISGGLPIDFPAGRRSRFSRHHGASAQKWIAAQIAGDANKPVTIDANGSGRRKPDVSATGTWLDSELPWRLSWGLRFSDASGPVDGLQDSRPAVGGLMPYFPTPGHDIVQVQWRATVDEDGHYSFAVAL